jgi:hypothetical protein
MLKSAWEPSSKYTHDEIAKCSDSDLARPFLPLLFRVARYYKKAAYETSVLPEDAALSPAAKVRLVYPEAGVHGCMKPEVGLLRGISPAITTPWHEAITSGFYAG